MPLERLVAVQYVRRFQTSSHGFEAHAEDGKGVSHRVFIKPLLTGRPTTGCKLAAEVIGAHIASELEVPTPDLVIVDIEPGFLAAAGAGLDGVLPGIALGSRWVEACFPPLGGPLLNRVTNPESVAGVTVLDTLIRNTDRHSRNFLLAPAAEGVLAFRLIYGDNQGFLVGETAPCIPQSPLAELVVDRRWFTPYFERAERLNGRFLEQRLKEMSAYGWDLGEDFPNVVTNCVKAAASQIGPLVSSGFHQFPNLCG